MTFDLSYQQDGLPCWMCPNQKLLDNPKIVLERNTILNRVKTNFSTIYRELEYHAYAYDHMFDNFYLFQWGTECGCFMDANGETSQSQGYTFCAGGLDPYSLALFLVSHSPRPIPAQAIPIIFPTTPIFMMVCKNARPFKKLVCAHAGVCNLLGNVKNMVHHCKT
mgnify:CR=1 FL=1